MTFDKVKEVILGCLNCDEAAIVPTAELTGDLGADSLDGVELIMAMEDSFGIDFPQDAAATFKTVGDIVTFIDANK